MRISPLPVVHTTPETIAPIHKKKPANCSSSVLSRINQKVTELFMPTPFGATVGSIVGLYSKLYIETYGPNFFAKHATQSSADQAEELFGEYLPEGMASSIGSFFGHFTAPVYVPQVNGWLAAGFSGGMALLSVALVNYWFKTKPKDEKVTESDIEMGLKTSPAIQKKEIPLDTKSAQLIRRITKVSLVKIPKVNQAVAAA